MATHTYIPLHEACLARVAAMLATQHGAGRILDLSSVIVVLPGRRAGRRLLELLCEHAHAHALVLVPPQTATVAAFCSRLVDRASAVLRATPLEQVCAWMEALAAVPAEVRAFFAPAAGEEQHAPDLFSVATTLTGLHAELAGERIAASTLASLPFDDEKEGLRWRAFATLQAHYRQVLDAHQVLDPYDAIERALAANATSILPGVRAVYSVGIADFHQQYAAALAAVADRLTIVAHGDPTWFEENGRLTPDSPLDKLTSRLDEQQIHVADNATAQAHTAVAVLAGLNGQYGPADITMGVPDVAVERALQQALQDAGITAHSALGIPFRQTELGRLVACLTALLDTQAYATFLEFIRHPLGEAWLRTQAGCTDTDAWFAALLLQAEAYAQDNIVDMITEDWRAPRGKYEPVRLALDHVKELLAAFAVERPLHEWPEVCNHALARLFSADVPDLQINQHDLAAIQAWCALMDAIRTARITCAGALPAVQALRWFMALLRQEEITTDSEAIAVDLVGWLELALDDAPVIIVTGLNEGIVPGPGTSDPFFPNNARAQLGLQHDARRLRRDRYLLRALEQGARVLHVICGRRTGQNDPLLPSRLLFDVSEARAAALVQQFYGTPPDQSATLDTKAVAPAALVTAPRAAPPVMYAFAPPQPGPLSRPLTRVSVSALDDYLACPYRFYLARENVAEAPMAMGELNAAQVGTLLHDTLAAWGATQENVMATDPQLILDALLPLFHTRANTMVGAAPHPAVKLQLGSCVHRLTAFAEKQAEETARGWHIDPACLEYAMELPLTVDAAPLTITGRIDRIDRRGDACRILDYKTGAPHPPEQQHQRKDEWVQLQLPLYAIWYATTRGVSPSVGYFNIPDTRDNTGVVTAAWTADDFAAALAATHRAIRRIHAAEFPRTDRMATCAYCPYTRICQRPRAD